MNGIHEQVASLGCWIWTKARNRKGYGTFNGTLAHRACWQGFYGKVPDDMQLHHLCETPACFNPRHLQVISSRAHVLIEDSIPAAYGLSTTSKCGHELTPQNTYVTKDFARRCRVCRSKYAREYGAVWREANREWIRARDAATRLRQRQARCLPESREVKP